MKYVGIYSQIRRNNIISFILLVTFPLQLIWLIWAFTALATIPKLGYIDGSQAFQSTIGISPIVIAIALLWLLIAWATHTSIINKITGARRLDRSENPRVYNIAENLCIEKGIKMSYLNIINDDSLNSFSSGISESSYSIYLSKGLVDKLDDEELKGVIAHEITHIVNKDVRLLIISILFAGIFTFALNVTFYLVRRPLATFLLADFGDGDGANIITLIQLLLVAFLLGTRVLGLILCVPLFLVNGSVLISRLAISRKREFIADAGAVELTKNPMALASALRKISADPIIEAVKRDDIAQMFIEHPSTPVKGLKSLFGKLFSTHPPIEKRIKILEQF